jgi:hypothetical protein
MDLPTQSNSEELQDLEKAFQEETISVPVAEPEKTITPTAPESGFSNTKKSLSDTDLKIANKVASLKKEAHDELATLKNLKNSIAKKIADIKELEETREKIKKELEKISNLESEVDSIKKEANDELA